MRIGCTRGDVKTLPPGGNLVWNFGGIPLFDMSPLGTNQMRAVALRERTSGPGRRSAPFGSQRVKSLLERSYLVGITR